MPGPLAPPEPTDPSQDALVLRAADAAEVVTPDDAPGMVPVDAERQSQIAAQAREFVDEVASLDPRSPAFTEKVDGINAIAGSEIARSGGFSSRMLERSQSSVSGAKRSGDDAQVKVATTLGDLRSTVEDLTPNQADLSTGRKILGMIPGGNKLAKYFQRYESAQTQLDKIIKSLMAGQDELRKDNATLADEKVQLWETMQQLSEYAVFAKALDAATVAKIEALRNGGRVDEAQKLESDVLFPVRQRHQDILTQLAVSVQGYLAMDLVRKNNTEPHQGRRACPHDDDRGASHGRRRGAGPGEPEDGPRPDRRGEQHHQRDDPADERDAARPDHPDPRAGDELRRERRDPAEGVRQRLPDDGRHRLLPVAGRAEHVLDRVGARVGHPARQAVPGACPTGRGRPAIGHAMTTAVGFRA